MFSQLLRIAVFSTIWLALRRRWRRLTFCLAAVALAVYIHGEFLAYVAALPEGAETAGTAGGFLPESFLLKNLVIAASLATFVVLEFRAFRQRKAPAKADRKPLPDKAEGTAKSDSDPVQGSDGIQGDGFDFLRSRGKLAKRTDQILREKGQGR